MATRHTLLALPVLAVLAGCITEPELKIRRDPRPTDAGDGWALSTPAAEGIDPGALGAVFDAFYSDTAHLNAVSLLVVRHGRLVAEGYARGPADRDVRRSAQSATKSVTSLVFGIAREQGSPLELDRTLYSIIPEKFGDDPARREITLRHLLTMRSGIAFDNRDYTVEMLVGRPDDPVRYTLAKPMYARPGERFYYRDADPQLLSAAVRRATGRTLEQIARGRLFAPLGITDYHWEADPEGTTLGPYSLFLRPRDMAKIGQLALQRGRWNGRQVVPEEWIRASTTARTVTDRGTLRYGYYWWVVPEMEAFAASGHGGNCIFVAPRQQLVIVMTSLPHTVDEAGTTLDRFLPLARGVMGALQR